MTEAEWNACADPQPMLGFLGGKVSDRKLRLFAVACCRRIWHLFQYEQCRHCVETSDRFADGIAAFAELHEALTTSQNELADVWHGPLTRWSGAFAATAADSACFLPDAEYPKLAAYHAQEAATEAARAVAEEKAYVPAPWVANHEMETDFEECQAQAILLRDIIRNPSCGTAIDTSWFAWNNRTVVHLAQAIYDERAFDRMPILADALEDAGCTDPDILDHCRGPGPHVRGCWVVDLLLAKT